MVSFGPGGSPIVPITPVPENIPDISIIPTKDGPNINIMIESPVERTIGTGFQRFSDRNRTAASVPVSVWPCAEIRAVRRDLRVCESIDCADKVAGSLREPSAGSPFAFLFSENSELMSVCKSRTARGACLLRFPEIFPQPLCTCTIDSRNSITCDTNENWQNEFSEKSSARAFHIENGRVRKSKGERQINLTVGRNADLSLLLDRTDWQSVLLGNRFRPLALHSHGESGLPLPMTASV